MTAQKAVAADMLANAVVRTPEGDFVASFVNGDSHAIVKFNASLQPLWEKQYLGSGRDYLGSIVNSADGGFVLAGDLDFEDGRYASMAKIGADGASVISYPPRSFAKTQAPTISGTTRVGNTLTATVRRWTPKASVAYQWLRNGTTIVGATHRTYKLVAVDVGGRITVQVAGSKPGYTTTTRVSKSTKAIALGILSRGRVTVTGTRRVGNALTAKTAKWSGGVSYHYQWYRNSTAITAAVDKSYTLTVADKDARFKVKVWTTKDGYKTSASRTSAKTAKIKA